MTITKLVRAAERACSHVAVATPSFGCERQMDASDEMKQPGPLFELRWASTNQTNLEPKPATSRPHWWRTCVVCVELQVDLYELCESYETVSEWLTDTSNTSHSLVRKDEALDHANDVAPAAACVPGGVPPRAPLCAHGSRVRPRIACRAHPYSTATLIYAYCISKGWRPGRGLCCWEQWW